MTAPHDPTRPGAPEPSHPGTPGPPHTGAPGPPHTGAPGPLHLGMPELPHAGDPEAPHPGTPGPPHTGAPGPLHLGMPELPHAGDPEAPHPGTPELPHTGDPEPLHLGAPEPAHTGDPHAADRAATPPPGPAPRTGPDTEPGVPTPAGSDPAGSDPAGSDPAGSDPAGRREASGSLPAGSDPRAGSGGASGHAEPAGLDPIYAARPEPDPRIAAGADAASPDPDSAAGRPPSAGPPRTFTADFLSELFRNPLDPGYADAAERRKREGPRTGVRQKVVSSATALTLAALGFLLVVAYRQTMADEPARDRARQELAEQVQRRRAETVELQERADRLRTEVNALREQQLGGAAVARLRDLEAATGVAPVRGPGAKVKLGDGPTPVDPVTGERKVDGRVKDTDLQLATNALWAAGAEAIAVNGQRLTATSTIRQAGEAILVDFRPVTTPYEVVAIGPDSLVDDFSDGYAGRFFKQLAARYGMSYEIGEVKAATLGAATELKLRQAVPSAPPSPDPGDEPTSEPRTSPSEGGR